MALPLNFNVKNLPNAYFFSVLKFMYIFFDQVQVDCNKKHPSKILHFGKKREPKFDLEL